MTTADRQAGATTPGVGPDVGGADPGGVRSAGAAADPVGTRPVGISLPGLLLGIGLGGFVDGIVLHQVLQWHHLLSSTDRDRLGLPFYDPTTVAGLEVNTLADGLFHAGTWVATVVGLAILYARVSRPRRAVLGSAALWGWVLAGWGAFNVVEGLVNHQLLGIHHVRSGANELAWDLGFLAFGAALVAVGWALQRRARPAREG